MSNSSNYLNVSVPILFDCLSIDSSICSGHGRCIPSTGECVCDDWFTGRSDVFNRDGFDCQIDRRVSDSLAAFSLFLLVLCFRLAIVRVREAIYKLWTQPELVEKYYQKQHRIEYEQQLQLRYQAKTNSNSQSNYHHTNKLHGTTAPSGSRDAALSAPPGRVVSSDIILGLRPSASLSPTPSFSAAQAASSAVSTLPLFSATVRMPAKKVFDVESDDQFRMSSPTETSLHRLRHISVSPMNPNKNKDQNLIVSHSNSHFTSLPTPTTNSPKLNQSSSNSIGGAAAASATSSSLPTLSIHSTNGTNDSVSAIDSCARLSISTSSTTLPIAIRIPPPITSASAPSLLTLGFRRSYSTRLRLLFSNSSFIYALGTNLYCLTAIISLILRLAFNQNIAVDLLLTIFASLTTAIFMTLAHNFLYSHLSVFSVFIKMEMKRKRKERIEQKQHQQEKEHKNESHEREEDGLVEPEAETEAEVEVVPLQENSVETAVRRQSRICRFLILFSYLIGISGQIIYFIIYFYQSAPSPSFPSSTISLLCNLLYYFIAAAGLSQTLVGIAYQSGFNTMDAMMKEGLHTLSTQIKQERMETLRKLKTLTNAARAAALFSTTISVLCLSWYYLRYRGTYVLLILSLTLNSVVIVRLKKMKFHSGGGGRGIVGGDGGRGGGKEEERNKTTIIGSGRVGGRGKGREKSKNLSLSSKLQRLRRQQSRRDSPTQMLLGLAQNRKSSVTGKEQEQEMGTQVVDEDRRGGSDGEAATAATAPPSGLSDCVPASSYAPAIVCPPPPPLPVT